MVKKGRGEAGKGGVGDWWRWRCCEADDFRKGMEEEEEEEGEEKEVMRA